MRLDLTQHGIKVTNIAPGAVETEFSMVRFKGDAERAAKVYEGFFAPHGRGHCRYDCVCRNGPRPRHHRRHDHSGQCSGSRYDYCAEVGVGGG